MPWRLGRSPLPLAVATAAVALAGIAGLAMAYDLPKGVGLILGLAFVPVVLNDLAIGLAVYIALIFIGQLPFTGPSETLAGMLVLVAWAGSLQARGRVLRGHGPLLGVLLAFALWTLASITWAGKPAASFEVLLPLGVAVVAFLAFVGFIRNERDFWIIATGFLIGAVLLTLAGFAEHGFTPAGDATQVAGEVDAGRLTAGGGDPNYLAAGLLPALIVGAGLFVHYRGPLSRFALAIGLAVLPVGIIASQSRGALIAAVLVLLGAFVIAKHHRVQVLAMILAAGALTSVWLVANPVAAQRIVNFDDGGAGRTDLWRVGWTMVGDHPLVGVGLNNFQQESPKYARTSGAIRFVEVVAEQPHVTHNLYLQFLAEEGIVGLALFLGFVSMCLRASWEAVRRFARSGRRALETQARLVLLGQLGFLAATFFISNASDVRFWVLLALGPGLLTIARRQDAGA